MLPLIPTGAFRMLQHCWLWLRHDIVACFRSPLLYPNDDSTFVAHQADLNRMREWHNYQAYTIHNAVSIKRPVLSSRVSRFCEMNALGLTGSLSKITLVGTSVRLWSRGLWCNSLWQFVSVLRMLISSSARFSPLFRLSHQIWFSEVFVNSILPMRKTWPAY